MRQGILCRGGWRVNSGAVDGYGVARERGTTEEVTKEVFGERSEQEPPHGATRRAKRLRGACLECLVVLTTLVSFLPCPYPLFSAERGRKPSRDQSEDPHPHRHLETGTPKG